VHERYRQTTHRPTELRRQIPERNVVTRPDRGARDAKRRSAEGVGCGEEGILRLSPHPTPRRSVALPRDGGPGAMPRNIFEISVLKSHILIQFASNIAESAF